MTFHPTCPCGHGSSSALYISKPLKESKLTVIFLNDDLCHVCFQLNSFHFYCDFHSFTVAFFSSPPARALLRHKPRNQTTKQNDFDVPVQALNVFQGGDDRPQHKPRVFAGQRAQTAELRPVEMQSRERSVFLPLTPTPMSAVCLLYLF